MAVLLDKQGDNDLATAKLKAEIEHWEREDKARADYYKGHLEKLNAKEFVAKEIPGKGIVMIPTSGDPSRAYWVTIGGEKVPVPMETKQPRAPNATETTIAQMKNAGLSEKEIADRLHPPLDAGEMTPGKQVDRALSLQKPDMMGVTVSPEEAWRRVQVTVQASKGQTPTGGLPRFNTLAEAKAAKKAGKIKAGDTILTPNGPITVQ
jgi:hypothetical protein